MSEADATGDMVQGEGTGLGRDRRSDAVRHGRVLPNLHPPSPPRRLACAGLLKRQIDLDIHFAEDVAVRLAGSRARRDKLLLAPEPARPDAFLTVPDEASTKKALKH